MRQHAEPRPRARGSPRMSMPSMTAPPRSGVMHAVQHAKVVDLAGAIRTEQAGDPPSAP